MGMGEEVRFITGVYEASKDGVLLPTREYDLQLLYLGSWLEFNGRR